MSFFWLHVVKLPLYNFVSFFSEIKLFAFNLGLFWLLPNKESLKSIKMSEPKNFFSFKSTIAKSKLYLLFSLSNNDKFLALRLLVFISNLNWSTVNILLFTSLISDFFWEYILEFFLS